MRVEVTKEGVRIPRRLLKKGVKHVEIRKEGGRLVVLPIPAPDDPIFGLGRRPVQTGLPDASAHYDQYLYDAERPRFLSL